MLARFLLALGFAPLATVFAQSSLSTDSTPSNLQYVGLDGPQVPLASASTPPVGSAGWQWWYFDYVSNTDRSSIQVVYYSGFGFGPLLGPTVDFYVQVSGTFPNGTSYGSFFAPASGPGIVTDSQVYASNGVWPGLGGWTATTGKSGEVTYVVTFATATANGTLTLNQEGTPHYPCAESQAPNFTPGVARPNLLGPGLGWSNAVPGASGSVSLNISGVIINNKGTGYHDSNFGVQEELSTFVQTWYWGRAVLANYIFVYFAYLPDMSTIKSTDPSNWYTSGYVLTTTPGPTTAGPSCDTQPEVLFCSAEQTPSQHAVENLKITTTGAIWTGGSATAGSAVSSNVVTLAVTFDAGGSSWAFNMTSMDVALAAAPNIPYSRWTTSAVGGQVGHTGRPTTQSWSTGKGMMELLDYGPPR